MIYSTYILVHPRTQQLQNALTLEDYHQIQALLEYCLQRQQLQQRRQDYQNREHARLVQAIYNNKLLQLDYRRQRAAQIQRLMAQYQQQLDRYDRARLLAAWEQQRAQQCFNRFIQHRYQPHHEAIHREIPITHERTTKDESHRDQQAPAQMPINAASPAAAAAAKNKIEAITTTTQQQEDEANQQQQEDDDQQVDDAYEQYQTQQLEDLLKHIFEKNTTARRQPAKINDEDDDEYAYAPCYRQQEDPEDEQMMADLLPILNDNSYRRDNDSTPPIPPKSMMKQQQQSMDTAPTNNIDDDDDDRAFLPDNVFPLQDVVENLVRVPTPAVKPPPPQSTAPPPQLPNKTTSVPLPPDKTTPAPPPPVPAKPTSTDRQKKQPEGDGGDSKERRDKLEKLTTIEQKLDQIATDGIMRLPLQYQVNDQGGLYLDGNTPNNRKFLMHEDSIIQCMLQLDQILSGGDPVVRERRRAIVKKAENLLEPLDQHKQAEWNKETRRQQQTGGADKKNKKHHRRHGKRKARVPVTA